jgi:hypothetical protein
MLPAVRLPRKFCCLHLSSPSSAIALLMAAQALVPLSSKPAGDGLSSEGFTLWLSELEGISFEADCRAS